MGLDTRQKRCDRDSAYVVKSTQVLENGVEVAFLRETFLVQLVGNVAEHITVFFVRNTPSMR
jgi:hypothetical protein